jgi:hypothetical protein
LLAFKNRLKTITTTLIPSMIETGKRMDCENASRSRGIREAKAGLDATNLAKVEGEAKICPTVFGLLSRVPTPAGAAASNSESFELNVFTCTAPRTATPSAAPKLSVNPARPDAIPISLL